MHEKIGVVDGRHGVSGDRWKGHERKATEEREDMVEARWRANQRWETNQNKGQAGKEGQGGEGRREEISQPKNLNFISVDRDRMIGEWCWDKSEVLGEKIASLEGDDQNGLGLII